MSYQFFFEAKLWAKNSAIIREIRSEMTSEEIDEIVIVDDLAPEKLLSSIGGGNSSIGGGNVFLPGCPVDCKPVTHSGEPTLKIQSAPACGVYKSR